LIDYLGKQGCHREILDIFKDMKDYKVPILIEMYNSLMEAYVFKD
jgi:pentatricopeptide repeat protein